jgi:hypothetical protein
MNRGAGLPSSMLRFGGKCFLGTSVDVLASPTSRDPQSNHSRLGQATRNPSIVTAVSRYSFVADLTDSNAIWSHVAVAQATHKRALPSDGVSLLVRRTAIYIRSLISRFTIRHVSGDSANISAVYTARMMYSP